MRGHIPESGDVDERTDPESEVLKQWATPDSLYV